MECHTARGQVTRPLTALWILVPDPHVQNAATRVVTAAFGIRNAQGTAAADAVRERAAAALGGRDRSPVAGSSEWATGQAVRRDGAGRGAAALGWTGVRARRRAIRVPAAMVTMASACWGRRL